MFCTWLHRRHRRRHRHRRYLLISNSPTTAAILISICLVYQAYRHSPPAELGVHTLAHKLIGFLDALSGQLK